MGEDRRRVLRINEFEFTTQRFVLFDDFFLAGFNSQPGRKGRSFFSVPGR
jgi:hypothetical protein